MDVTDINGYEGPFWDAYQAERKRGRIMDNPDYVPFWFLRKLAHDRVAAARCAMERTRGALAEQMGRALWDLEKLLQGGAPFDELEQVVLALLGADEIEVEF